MNVYDLRDGEGVLLMRVSESVLAAMMMHTATVKNRGKVEFVEDVCFTPSMNFRIFIWAGSYIKL